MRRFARTALVLVAGLAAGPALATQAVIGDEPPHATEAVMPLLHQMQREKTTGRITAHHRAPRLGPPAQQLLVRHARVLGGGRIGMLGCKPVVG